MLTSTPRQAPAVPVLTYSADSQFTISNYNAALTYAVTGCTRSGSSLTSVSNNATITAAYGEGTPSAARTMLILAHTYYSTGYASTTSPVESCGGSAWAYCSSGYSDVVTGSTNFGSGTYQPSLCGGSCPATCFYNGAGNCYNRALTDYTSSGYTLQGSKWGKSV